MKKKSLLIATLAFAILVSGCNSIENPSGRVDNDQSKRINNTDNRPARWVKKEFIITGFT